MSSDRSWSAGMPSTGERASAVVGRMGDQQRIGHHRLLGHRLGQHLAVAVVDASPDGGDGDGLGELRGGQQGRVVLVAELLHGDQPGRQGDEDQRQHQPHGAGAPAQQDGRAHRLGGGGEVWGTGSGTLSGTCGQVDHRVGGDQALGSWPGPPPPEGRPFRPPPPGLPSGRPPPRPPGSGSAARRTWPSVTRASPDHHGQQAADHQRRRHPHGRPPDAVGLGLPARAPARRPEGWGGGARGRIGCRPGACGRRRGGRRRHQATSPLAAGRRVGCGQSLDDPQAGRLGPAVATDLVGGGTPGAAGHQPELGVGAAHAGQARRAVAVVGGHAGEEGLDQPVLAGVVGDDHAASRPAAGGSERVLEGRRPAGRAPR